MVILRSLSFFGTVKLTEAHSSWCRLCPKGTESLPYPWVPIHGGSPGGQLQGPLCIWKADAEELSQEAALAWGAVGEVHP